MKNRLVALISSRRSTWRLMVVIASCLCITTLTYRVYVTPAFTSLHEIRTREKNMFPDTGTGWISLPISLIAFDLISVVHQWFTDS